MYLNQLQFSTPNEQELNERERAEHATRKYDQLQSLLKELEERNVELEQKFAEVCSFHVFSRLLLKYHLMLMLAQEAKTRRI